MKTKLAQAVGAILKSCLLLVSLSAAHCTTSGAQTLASGTYTVANQSSGLLWDDPNSSTQSLSNVTLWSSNGGINQEWTFSLQSDGYYLIVNQTSGLGLNDPGSNTATGVLLIQYATSPLTSNEEWSVTAGSDGGWVVKNRLSGLVVDPNGNTQGAYIQQSTATGATSQDWLITSTTATTPTLTFGPYATQAYPGTLTLSASSPSPGAITYSVVSGPATISGNTLTLAGGGYITVKASQAASTSYTAATATTTFLATTATSNTLTFSLGTLSNSPDPASDSPNFHILDSTGAFYLQNSYSQYDTTAADHVWNIYTGASGANAYSSLSLSSTNSQYDTQTLCTSSNPVWTQFESGTGLTDGGGAYVDGNFCDMIGMWVDPDTGNWYGIIHNEIYPNAPRIDVLSYAVSTNKGSTWTMEGPIATSPYGIGDSEMKYYEYGNGDPRLLVDTASGYFYLSYKSRILDASGSLIAWWQHISRAPISQKMAPSSWQKWYNGSWGQTEGILWTCDAYLNASCATGTAPSAMEANIGTDDEPSKSESLVWPVASQATSDENNYTNAVWDNSNNLSWNVYLQQYVMTSMGLSSIDFYTTSSLATQDWTYAGSVPYTNTSVWYNWSLDAGNLTSTQVTGSSFDEFCVIDCNSGGTLAPVTVAFKSSSTAPAYYTSTTGSNSSTNTYIITNATTPSTSFTATSTNKWTFVPVGDGFFYIEQNSEYLEVPDDDTGRAWGATVSLAAPMASGTSAPELSRQQWRFEKITAIDGVAPSSAQYRLINRYSGLALSFTSTAFDSSYLSYAVTAPPRDWDPASGSAYDSWKANNQELVFVAQ